MNLPFPDTEAKGIYLDIRSSNDGKHPPVINEFEAKGKFISPPAAEAVIPRK